MSGPVEIQNAADSEEHPSPAAFAGEVATTEPGRLSGWAVNLASPHLPVTVDIHLGIRWIGAARTLISRPSLQARFETSEPIGFEFIIPAFLRGRSLRVFRIYIANTDIELEGSPIILNAKDERSSLEELQTLTPK